jgi:hypothetical protein
LEVVAPRQQFLGLPQELLGKTAVELGALRRIKRPPSAASRSSTTISSTAAPLLSASSLSRR